MSGTVLEAQLETGGRYLLFITHDTPYEEQLDILLLDRSFRQLDLAWLSWSGTTGGFRNLNIESDTSVVFDFFGERPWWVRVFEKPAFRLPLLSEPLGLHRKFGLSRHFAVDHAFARVPAPSPSPG